ncbi:BSD domain protein [Xylogone sp. PMI_703]|nr:BSD domain protein [Xylogone sp. PMI_703]
MDLAYDHIQEEALARDEAPASDAEGKDKKPESSLNADFQEAYKAISSSPWGAKLGGFFGSVVKQGESVYKEAQQELSEIGVEASKGFTDLRSSIINRTRSLSLVQRSAPSSSTAPAEASDAATNEKSTEEVIKESEGVLARLRTEAAKRLKEIEKAEDAADEALLKFGTNIRNFLRDAVQIAPPSDTPGQQDTVLFESKDASGKRVFHSTRFDAQLHVIHTSVESFTKDPDSPEFEKWIKGFDVEKKTADIARDLEQYAELRTTMEKLVPDSVSYADFWKRYYFLRHSVETAEARRKDLLKAATTEEDIAWDEDSSSETEESKSKAASSKAASHHRTPSEGSQRTLHPTTTQQPKSTEPRKSNDEKSQADSDTSYDVVGAASGAPSQAPSRAPNSPKDNRDSDDSEESDESEESEEEDWE